MRGLQDTITRLSALRERPFGLAGRKDSRLVQFQGFGSNPGHLNAWAYLPEGLSKGAPLVVVPFEGVPVPSEKSPFFAGAARPSFTACSRSMRSISETASSFTGSNP